MTTWNPLKPTSTHCTHSRSSSSTNARERGMLNPMKIVTTTTQDTMTSLAKNVDNKNLKIYNRLALQWHKKCLQVTEIVSATPWKTFCWRQYTCTYVLSELVYGSLTPQQPGFEMCRKRQPLETVCCTCRLMHNKMNSWFNTARTQIVLTTLISYIVTNSLNVDCGGVL